jgi:hypothetical protein
LIDYLVELNFEVDSVLLLRVDHEVDTTHSHESDKHTKDNDQVHLQNARAALSEE